MILDASPGLTSHVLYRIENRLTRLTWFVLASAHTRWPRLRGTYRLLDKVNGSRREHESETCHF